MISKLLKHEYLRTRKTVAGIWLVAVILALFGNLLSYTGWPGLAPLGSLLLLFLIFLLLPVVQLALGIDYWRSSYLQVGYFTQSLPIAGRVIFRAKLLWVTIVSIASLLLTIGIGLLSFNGLVRNMASEPVSVWAVLGGFWESATNLLPWWGIVLVALLGFVLLMSIAIQLYFAASIGSEEPLNRWGIGGPILVAVALYFVQQILVVISVLAVPIGLNVESMQFVKINWVQAMLSETSVAFMPVGFVSVLVLVPLVLLWRTSVSWQRKVSLA